MGKFKMLFGRVCPNTIMETFAVYLTLNEFGNYAMVSRNGLILLTH